MLESFPFKAVIFDMDGVLIDSEWFYFNELADFSETFDLGLTRDDRLRMVGNSAQEFRRSIQEWWKRAGHGEITQQQAVDFYVSWAKDHRPDFASLLNPGAKETVATLHDAGVRVALASSSPRRNIESVLAQCGMEGMFEPVVSGEEFDESKPNPQIYLHTLDVLGLPASACCCVEDSVYGIEAGRCAGLTVVAKREERFGFSQEKADAIIDELPDLLRLG